MGRIDKIRQEGLNVPGGCAEKLDGAVASEPKEFCLFVGLKRTVYVQDAIHGKGLQKETRGWVQEEQK